MLAAEVHQNKAQPFRLPLVAPQPRGGDVIVDHAQDAVIATGLMCQVIAEFGGNDFREMLMLGDSIDFLFRKTGEGQTILDRNHGDPRHKAALQPAGRKARHPRTLAAGSQRILDPRPRHVEGHVVLPAAFDIETAAKRGVISWLLLADSVAQDH